MRRRQGFTLVELLVAMALIIFIMAILSQAFGAAMTTFRNLKASGDMAEKLRATTQLLQRDLGADHFEGKKRLSDPNFWLNGPPQQGFFQILQGRAGTSEASGYATVSAASITARITPWPSRSSCAAIRWATSSRPAAVPAASSWAISVRRRPVRAVSGRTSGGSYNYPVGRGRLVPATIGRYDQSPIPRPARRRVPLYTLYRRQRLLVPDNNLVPTPQPAANLAQFQEIELLGPTASGTVYFNSPIDITVPRRRFVRRHGSPITTHCRRDRARSPARTFS